MDEKTERGGISIELEHIFPIIKKWLYSEKEIFLRESPWRKNPAG